MKAPQLEDYQQLLEHYAEAIKSQTTPRLELVFARVMRMLIQPSDFNASLPQPFVTTARRYLAKKPDALSHLRDPEVQQFFLSDLYDFVQLKALRKKRSPAAGTD
ncbi:hypothetical protein [Marinospirillum perlucidum]|uniref:hypothetical protein n=1 Tax=Marinospirillum perlucidum TaxID=1982602 RepID=UPI000DF150DC|nr:hypothetical protein [Marinospirillum perlucidum]